MEQRDTMLGVFWNEQKMSADTNTCIILIYVY